MQTFLIIIAAVIIIASIIFGKYATNKREQELSTWANSRGFHFSSEKQYGFDYDFQAFSCLKRGTDRYAYNVSSGNINGRKIFGFDYHYRVNSGSKSSPPDRFFSAIILESTTKLKPLFIRGENLIDKLAEFAGFNDIDFESAEFSRKFFVKSPDKKWAYDVIHPQMMEFLLSSPVFTIQFDSDQIMLFRDRIYTAVDFESALNLAEGMIKRFPEYLVNEQKGA